MNSTKRHLSKLSSKSAVTLRKKKNGREGWSVHRCLTLELIEEKDKDSWCNQCLHTYIYKLYTYVCMDVIVYLYTYVYIM